MRVANQKLPVCIKVCDRHADVEQLYGLLYAIRAFEESLLDLFDRGQLVGTTHTCIGQEATAVGVLSALNLDRDVVFSNHRGHGHFLAYCGEVERLYLEIMGKPGGVCAGRGGSQHLHFRNFYSNGVQGGIVPVATGTALAQKAAGESSISVVFLGDGTLGEGAVYEALNIAALWSLPVLYVIDNNGYAQSTPRHLQMSGSMRGRLEAFGIAVHELETTDVREVLQLAAEVADAVRGEQQPRGLILRTYRLGPHSKGDDTRDPAEIRKAWKREPLGLIRAELPDEVALAIEQQMAEIVDRSRERALADHDPTEAP